MNTHRQLSWTAVLAVASLLGACSDRLVEAEPPPPVREPVWDRWSSPSTWPDGRVPGVGAAVVIPNGRRVLLDVSPPPLASLRVEGHLRFDQRDLNLSAGWVVVHGTLEAGTEAQPYLHRGVITLTGNDASQDVLGMGAKVLAVVGGTLELHGQPRLGWTRLAETAPRGATELVLEAAPDWRPGDRLVVASTDFEPTQAEEVVVQAVAGRTVTLAHPLRYAHWGVAQTIAGRVVHERAEVGLLTRNLVVRGEEGVSGLGGHLMVMGGSTARIAGVEFYQMGQKGRMARYPIHWHMAGDVDGQYARGNSIWRSFNRCVTVHGTHRLLLDGNVCYDHLGHGFFLEDGIETGNVLRGNLGVLTRAPARGEAVLPSDAQPATFWITNPDNTLRGNVAGGSQGFGFWYALPEHPTGLSATPAVWPRRTPLREFVDNVAHSNRRAGLNVDDGPRPDGVTETVSYRPREVPGADSPPVAAAFRGLTAYKHAGQAVWLRGSHLRLQDAVLADNAIGVTFAASETLLQNSLVVGETENRGAVLPAGFPVRGFEFYDGVVGAERVVFANFRPTAQRQASGIGFKRANGFTFSPANFAAEVRFVDSNPLYLESARPDRDGDKNAVALDADGSLTGTAGAFVVAGTPHLLTSRCERRADWNAHVCPGRYLGLSLRNDADAPVAPLEVRRDDGAAVELVGIPNNPKAAAFSAIAGRAYAFGFRAATPSRPRLTLSRAAAGDWVRVSFPYPVARFVVYRDGDASRPFPAAATLAELAGGAGDRYFLDEGGVLHLKLVPRPGQDRVTVSVDPR